MFQCTHSVIIHAPQCTPSPRRGGPRALREMRPMSRRLEICTLWRCPRGDVHAKSERSVSDERPMYSRSLIAILCVKSCGAESCAPFHPSHCKPSLIAPFRADGPGFSTPRRSHCTVAHLGADAEQYESYQYLFLLSNPPISCLSSADCYYLFYVD